MEAISRKKEKIQPVKQKGKNNESSSKQDIRNLLDTIISNIHVMRVSNEKIKRLVQKQTNKNNG